MTDLAVNNLASEIERKLVALFSANSGLSDIKQYLIGEPEFIPQHFFPVAIIFVLSQNPVFEESGIYLFDFEGVIAVETTIPERLAVDPTQSVQINVSSYTTIRNYLDTMTTIVLQNLDLDNIAHVASKSTVRAIIPGRKEYYINPRPDGFTNRGEFRFNVQTQQEE